MLARPPDVARIASLRAPAPCSCHTSSISTPAGEIIVVRVFGDVDLGAKRVVRAALTDAHRRCPTHLVADVAGIGYCSAQGLALLAHAPTEPAMLRPAHRSRTVYLHSGMAPRLQQRLDLLRTSGALPICYPSAGAAVLAALAQLRGQLHRDALIPYSHGLAARPALLTGRACDRASNANRELARRHRSRMYDSALWLLRSSEDPEAVAEDIATLLRIAQTALHATGP